MKNPADSAYVKRTHSWMEYLARILVVGTVIASIAAIIGYSYDLYRHGRQKHYIGWFSSAGFVLLTIPISIRLIVQHLTHWYAPGIQKYVVRIIWMVPIYSVESWFALRFRSASIYLETLRECYEAYVIFSFLYFLIALLGEEQQLVQKLKQKSSDYGRHSWPVSLFVSPWMMGHEVLQKCKFGVFQYVIIKNLFAIVVCILASWGLYDDGKFQFRGVYLYQCLICNISQLWALYCLVLFYFATKDELAPYRPVGKFLSVKTVVFFTWWQAMVIDIVTMPLKKNEEFREHWTMNEVSKGVQDYLICIEMFIASIAFTYAFTYRDYQPGKLKQGDDEADDENEESKPFVSAFLESSVPDDILTDLRRFARGNLIVRNVLGGVGVNIAGIGSADAHDFSNTTSTTGTTTTTSASELISEQHSGDAKSSNPHEEHVILNSSRSGSVKGSSSCSGRNDVARDMEMGGLGTNNNNTSSSSNNSNSRGSTDNSPHSGKKTSSPSTDMVSRENDPNS